jgi:predicted O-methyltransferase YrrM
MTDRNGMDAGHCIPPETPVHLFGIARAFECSRAFHLAHNLDVFAELGDGPLSLEELAKRISVEHSALEKIVVTAAAMGLLETDGKQFRNSHIADRYLVPGRPEYIGDSIWLMSGWWDRFNEFSHEVIKQHGKTGEFRHERFIGAMRDYARTGEGERLAEAVDLSGRKHLLDLGGGPGSYAAYLCKKYPNLRATVFDLPDSEPVFREVVASFGVEDRIEFLPGDLEKDPIGEGYDAVLVSNMMHGYRGDVIPPMVHTALVPGGLIIVRDFILRPDKSGPLAAALFNMRMGAYTEDEMTGFLEQAGFAGAEVKRMGDYTIVMAEKP